MCFPPAQGVEADKRMAALTGSGAAGAHVPGWAAVVRLLKMLWAQGLCWLAHRHEPLPAAWEEGWGLGGYGRERKQVEMLPWGLPAHDGDARGLKIAGKQAHPLPPVSSLPRRARRTHAPVPRPPWTGGTWEHVCAGARGGACGGTGGVSRMMCVPPLQREGGQTRANRQDKRPLPGVPGKATCRGTGTARRAKGSSHGQHGAHPAGPRFWGGVCSVGGTG